MPRCIAPPDLALGLSSWVSSAMVLVNTIVQWTSRNASGLIAHVHWKQFYFAAKQIKGLERSFTQAVTLPLADEYGAPTDRESAEIALN